MPDNYCKHHPIRAIIATVTWLTSNDLTGSELKLYFYHSAGGFKKHKASRYPTIN